MSLQPPTYIKKTLQHPPELAEFQDFVCGLAPRSYLEIGCKYGGSLWAVTTIMEIGSRIVAIDLARYEEIRSSLVRCCQDLMRLGYDVRLIKGDSTAPGVVAQASALGPFDLIFIDGNHTEQGVRADFKNYGQLGKVICFHDINRSAPIRPDEPPIEVPKVWQELKETHKDRATFREIKRDQGHNGFGILQWLT